MKLLRHETVLGIATLLFIPVALLISAFPKNGAVIVNHPDTAATPYLININTADREELDILDGIGPALADRIIEYRENNGPFESADELTEVSGIGPATVDNIKEYIEV